MMGEGVVVVVDLEKDRLTRKDGKLGWRSTDKMREDLFEQEQEALDD